MKIDEEKEDVKMDIDWVLINWKFAWRDVLITTNSFYSIFLN